MAVLDTVVGPTADLLLIGIAERIHRRAVRAQPVGGDRLGLAVTLQCLLHEGECCILVPGPRDVALEDLAFVVDRTQ